MVEINPHENIFLESIHLPYLHGITGHCEITDGSVISRGYEFIGLFVFTNRFFDKIGAINCYMMCLNPVGLMNCNDLNLIFKNTE